MIAREVRVLRIVNPPARLVGRSQTNHVAGAVLAGGLMLARTIAVWFSDTQGIEQGDRDVETFPVQPLCAL